jgi:hypothetical protein
VTRYTRPPSWPWFYAAALGVTLAAAAVGWAGSALGHEAPSGWAYDPDCCNTMDCEPLPEGAVTVSRDGWRVELAPGQHRQAPRGGVWLVPHGRTMTQWTEAPAIRHSGDEHYHGCILGGHMRCIYVPPGGV